MSTVEDLRRKTEADFEAFVPALRAQGIRKILDTVPDHMDHDESTRL